MEDLEPPINWGFYPLVMTNIANWKITIFNGKIHYKWPFSIAMLNYQRVVEKISDRLWHQIGLSGESSWESSFFVPNTGPNTFLWSLRMSARIAVAQKYGAIQKKNMAGHHWKKLDIQQGSIWLNNRGQMDYDGRLLIRGLGSDTMKSANPRWQFERIQAVADIEKKSTCCQQ